VEYIYIYTSKITNSPAGRLNKPKRIDREKQREVDYECDGGVEIYGFLTLSHHVLIRSAWGNCYKTVTDEELISLFC
jgi:hypothetical protein